MPPMTRSTAEGHAAPGRGFLESGWLVLPLIATLGGTWAFSRPHLPEDPATLAIALALVVGGWQGFWLTLTRADWASPLAEWQDWQEAAPLPAWPYLRPGTPGAYLHRRLSQASAWWRHVGRSALLRPLARGAVAFTVTLLLSAALGRHALLLSLGYITLTELALLWHEGQGEVGGLWEGLALIGLPWMLGAVLIAGEGTAPIISGLALALTISLFAQRSWWALLGPALGAAYLILRGREMAAGWLLLLALPGFIVLTGRPSAESHRQAVGPWVIGMVALVAWVL